MKNEKFQKKIRCIKISTENFSESEKEKLSKIDIIEEKKQFNPILVQKGGKNPKKVELIKNTLIL